KVRETPDEVSPSWVLVYRDLCEWAALYECICYRSFATDTLMVRDGLLRSKLFRGGISLFSANGSKRPLSASGNRRDARSTWSASRSTARCSPGTTWRSPSRRRFLRLHLAS